MIDMFNLDVNSYRNNFILSTGTLQKFSSYLTETDYLKYTNCDHEIPSERISHEYGELHINPPEHCEIIIQDLDHPIPLGIDFSTNIYCE